MRTFDDIEGKIYLKGVNFDFEEYEDEEGNIHAPHIALTSGQGAASGLNKPYLLKAVDTPHSDNKTTIKEGKKEMPKKQEEVVEKDTTIQKEMKDLKKQVKELTDALARSERENAINTIAKSVADFGFDTELTKEVSDVLVDLTESQNKTISKTFSFFIDKIKDLEVEKEKDAGEKTPLAKMLDEEVGDSATEEEVESTEDDFITNIKKAQERLTNKK